MIIDFRSDASTTPTPEMRAAMADAKVGNDDFGEDPTINRLEQTLAGLLGHEDAVFVHSGTMANVSAVMAHVAPGETVLVGKHFHIFDFEAAAMERVVGCRVQTLEDETAGGRTRLLYEHAMLGDTSLPSHPRLLCLENTVSRLGGTLIDVSHLDEVTTWARSHGMSVHLDGARLFNAAVALGVELRELAALADTVSVTLTKAVGAPAGAVVAGPRNITERIRRYRWMLGGNWKQGGVFAAACLYGLQTVEEAIVRDHANARRLAEGLNAIDGCRVDLDRVVTNIVFWELTDPEIDAEQLRAQLTARGIVFGRWKPGSFDGGRRCRLVTHRDISTRHVDLFVQTVRKALAAHG
jgi:threonine aldolase